MTGVAHGETPTSHPQAGCKQDTPKNRAGSCQGEDGRLVVVWPLVLPLICQSRTEILASQRPEPYPRPEARLALPFGGAPIGYPLKLGSRLRFCKLPLGSSQGGPHEPENRTIFLCCLSTFWPTLDSWKPKYPWRSVVQRDGNPEECAG